MVSRTISVRVILCVRFQKDFFHAYDFRKILFTSTIFVRFGNAYDFRTNRSRVRFRNDLVTLTISVRSGHAYYFDSILFMLSVSVLFWSCVRFPYDLVTRTISVRLVTRTISVRFCHAYDFGIIFFMSTIFVRSGHYY